MKERPIIFSSEMVRAIILDGRKTQTRRVVRLPSWFQAITYVDDAQYKDCIERRVKCPYGGIGERLWCKETFIKCEEPDDDGNYIIYYRADYPNDKTFGPCKPSIYMPRWASRITLEITGVRVERIQDITEEDAKAEGCEIGHGLTDDSPFFAREAFQKLWDSINAKRGYGWNENPWVFVISFKKVD